MHTFHTHMCKVCAPPGSHFGEPKAWASAIQAQGFRPEVAQQCNPAVQVMAQASGWLIITAPNSKATHIHRRTPIPTLALRRKEVAAHFARSLQCPTSDVQLHTHKPKLASQFF